MSLSSSDRRSLALLAIQQGKVFFCDAFPSCYNAPRMIVSLYWQHCKAFWQGAWRAYAGDIRRLDGASRPMAFAVVFLGILSGLVPVGVLVIVFRLTDALVGARAVRVQTSDLRQALITAGVVWLLATLVAVGRELLQGIAARVTSRTAAITLPVSLLVCLFPVMPFRAVLFVLMVIIVEAWPERRAIRIGATVLCMCVGLTGVATVLGYILSRSITVGSFLMFTGIIASMTTWFVFRRVAPSAVYARHN